ncbi:cupin domain-containing protein [Paenibacillus sp. Aloe-11]|uniref:cupin domain-containing protein n=1 Tax=Paenibacillus sp. Aloe-11 TaxID=1050222 RepID=UPI00024F0728|nr:cupin domain-containing protein [Paenibacillus sp. Aloe-11]EHS59697.1 cupin domain-containing protein [Paenibacillus sp. Aloe-11]
MAVSYMDFTSPSAQFAFDLRNNPAFIKDERNYFNLLSIKQLNTLGNMSMLDTYLDKGNAIEPHYHQNASELVYCISGEIIVSIINPFTKELRHYAIRPGQTASVPQAWWHYDTAAADGTHFLAIFDAPVPEIIPASDMLRLTPAEVFAHVYCLDEAKVKEAFAPLNQTVIIGPPKGCQKATQSAHYQPQPNPASSAHPPCNQGYGLRPYQQSDSNPQRPQVIGNGWAHSYHNGP